MIDNIKINNINRPTNIPIWRYATWYCFIFLCNATSVLPVLSLWFLSFLINCIIKYCCLFCWRPAVMASALPVAFHTLFTCLFIFIFRFCVKINFYSSSSYVAENNKLNWLLHAAWLTLRSLVSISRGSQCLCQWTTLWTRALLNSWLFACLSVCLSVYKLVTLRASEAATQCVVFGPVCVCGCVYLVVCYHSNSKLRASILNKLGL